MIWSKELGRSGIRVGRLGLGCTTFGREIDEAQSFAVMDRAMELGLNLFDTAEAYGGGEAREYRRTYLGVDDEREVSGEKHSSEKIIGRWLRSRGARKDVVLVTKVFTNFTCGHVREALEASLERLQTDFVDVYLYHKPDPATPAEESVTAMDQVVRSGLARAIGCSNYTAAQLEESLAVSAARGLGRFEVVENNYNLAAPQIENDMLPICEREQIGVLTYSPLGAGFLTGKYTTDRSTFPKGSRFDVIPGHADVYFNDRNFRVVENLRAMAERIGVPVTRLAIGWVLQNPAVSNVLVGARSPAHLENAHTALKMEFHAEWMAEMRSWG